MSRFEVDYVELTSYEELMAFMEEGYSIRMASKSPRTSPSLISPSSITIQEDEKGCEKTANKSSLKDFLESLADDDDLDTLAIQKRRKEQAYLQGMLFNGKTTAECTLCHRTLPTSLMVVAHIKRRSECTPSERKDFDNIVTPMCKLGCDDLFERGFVSVRNGKVARNTKWPVTPDLDKSISFVEGNDVSNWDTSKDYYQWHSKRYLKEI